MWLYFLLFIFVVFGLFVLVVNICLLLCWNQNLYCFGSLFFCLFKKPVNITLSVTAQCLTDLHPTLRFISYFNVLSIRATNRRIVYTKMTVRCKYPKELINKPREQNGQFLCPKPRGTYTYHRNMRTRNE